MWLRNYYNQLTAIFLADDTLSSSSQPTDYNPPIMYHLMNDTWRTATYQADQYSMQTYRSVVGMLPGKFNAVMVTDAGSYNSASIGLCFGSGTTPVTYDDYNLDSIITSGLSLVSASGTPTQATAYDSGTHHISSIRSFTVNNSSASPITIAEFGITFPTGFASGNSTSVHALMYREVLATPVTLNPSESVIVSFNRDAEVYNYTPY